MRKKCLFGLLCLILLLLAGYLIINLTDDGQEAALAEISDGDYYVGLGYEGLRVRWVRQALGLGDGIGMNGAYYDDALEEAVIRFQADHDLPTSGQVGLATWQMLGFSSDEWQRCGLFHTEPVVDGHDPGEIRIEAMIETAMSYVGDPYVIGASGPPGKNYGVDCSGLVIQALYAADVQMKYITPESHAHPGHEYESRNIWARSGFRKVKPEKRRRGDLIFYEDSNGQIMHVAICLNESQVVEAWPDSVQISDVIDERHSRIKGVMRPIR